MFFLFYFILSLASLPLKLISALSLTFALILPSAFALLPETDILLEAVTAVETEAAAVVVGSVDSENPEVHLRVFSVAVAVVADGGLRAAEAVSSDCRLGQRCGALGGWGPLF